MKKYQSKIKPARKPLISALEPRLLLDGAAVATAVDVLTDTQLQSIEDQNSSETDDKALAPTEVRAVDVSLNNGRKEVVFIDSNIENYQTLIESIDEGIEVQLIDGNQDGLAQIAMWADTHSGYDAIHILSHGSEGQIDLGSATLNSESITSYSDELRLLGNSLNEKGDLLLYGCEVSQGDDQRFIEQLSLITGADVAASDDLTGSALLGGDWELEKSIGVINSDNIESDVYELTLSDNNAPIFSAGSGAGAAPTQISVFSYPNLNGYDLDPGEETENANLASIIQSEINDGGAYTLDTSIQNFTDDDFEDKLNESGFFFMTDMEHEDPDSDAFLPDSAQSIIKSWVSNGGVIMMTGTYGSDDVSFLNNIFGWDLTSQYGSSWSLNEDNASGTPFEGGPTSLNRPSATDSIGRGTVEGFTAIYGTDDNATVATIEYGAGTIIFLGYDFYDSGVSGTGFTDTATQYGNDVETGSNNSNDWVQEIIPRALDYSARLSSSSYELLSDGSSLTLDSDFIVTDSDTSDSVTLSVSSVTAVQKTEGSDAVTLSDDEAVAYEGMLVIANENALDSETSTTTVDWNFSADAKAFSALAGNESLVLTYVIEAEDSNGATATTEIEITIHGFNDAPDIQAVDVMGTITEGTSVADSGSITFTDVDLSDTPTATKSTKSVSAIGQDGTTALTLTAEQRAAIEAAFSIENVNTNTNDGTVNWAYNISEANLNFLGAGEV
ncbi:VCBS repeat-containing protein, partial [Marinomonas balearica]